MRILMATGEGPPLQTPGELIDFMGALPAALRQRGHDVSVVMPCYRLLSDNRDFSTEKTGISVDVRVGEKNYVAEYLEGEAPGGLQIFLVKCDEFFDRPGIFGQGGEDYDDNAERFIFFSKAVIELARRLTPAVQILHAHDWPAALIPVLVHAYHLPFATVLTVHQVEKQGSFWGLDFKLTNLPERFFTLRGIEFFGRMNLLKGGILYADRITVVSARHQAEILSGNGAAGLDVVLCENAYKIRPVLNGADYTRWNPANDPSIPAAYSPANLAGKRINRDELLAASNLLPSPKGPVFALFASEVEAAGVLVPLLDRFLSDDVRLIVLGQVEGAVGATLAIAARRFHGKLAYGSIFDKQSVHLLQAGSDIALLPSRFEPSGVSVMYNLKYGTLPVARATRGIEELIEDQDPTRDSGYGYLSYAPGSEAFWDAIKRASLDFENVELWQTLMKRAMACDFSWGKSAERYEQVYSELVSPEAKAAA